jgi:uncharacterized protein YbjT (DUF2867 family)
MRVLLFGATGMVGQGVLRECLLANDVEGVLVVGRSTVGRTDPKLRELLVSDLADLTAIESQLAGFDACFFCVGVSSLGLSPERYVELTYDLTLAVARVVVRHNPALTFVYVSGAGTDSTERGRVRWARVKGKTENALLRLPFKAAYLFRPGAILPRHGVRSRTAWIRWLYLASAPIAGLWRALLPDTVSTSEEVGRAMLTVARTGYPSAVMGIRDINRAARQEPPPA